MKRILLVEDEQALARHLTRLLQAEGFTVVHAATQRAAVACLEETPLDLALVDISLPDGNGFAVCTAIKQAQAIPVLFLTASADEDSVVTGLCLGGDDYITKPFGTSELLARIRTSLRHSNRMASNSPLYIRPYKCQGLILDFEKRMLTLDGEEIHLTPVEYKIVAYLARNSGKVMTYASVMANVWGPFTDNNNRILRVNMANIRRKIERNPSQPQFLFTEVGVGYRMCEDENEV